MSAKVQKGMVGEPCHAIYTDQARVQGGGGARGLGPPPPRN